MNKIRREMYEAPFTERTSVEVEAGICAGSNVEIQQKDGNVEVDDYASIDNDVTFQ